MREIKNVLIIELQRACAQFIKLKTSKIEKIEKIEKIHA